VVKSYSVGNKKYGKKALIPNMDILLNKDISTKIHLIVDVYFHIFVINILV